MNSDRGGACKTRQKDYQIIEDKKSETEISNNIGITKEASKKLYKLLRQRMFMVQTTAMTILLYDSECGTLSIQINQKLETRGNEILQW